MRRLLFLSAALMGASLLGLPVSYAKPALAVYKMPDDLVKRLHTETAQRQRGECDKQREFASATFFALNQKLLVLIGLPDYFCHASSFLPVTIDKQGHWQAGAVIESYPTFLLHDNSEQLWLVSHWEIEGVYPLLHHSLDGAHWQEISLPKERQVDCCFEYLKQVCPSDSLLQLKFTDMDEVKAGYWQTTRSESLKAAPNWQKSSPAPQQCRATSVTIGDWQRQEIAHHAQIQFYSATQGFKVQIPRWLKLSH